MLDSSHSFFFFFNDTATTEIYTLSLHDALPISHHHSPPNTWSKQIAPCRSFRTKAGLDLSHFELSTFSARDALQNVESLGDRKSTRLNSSQATSRMPSSA